MSEAVVLWIVMHLIYGVPICHCTILLVFFFCYEYMITMCLSPAQRLLLVFVYHMHPKIVHEMLNYAV